MLLWTSLVTLLAIALYFLTGLRVSDARGRFGVKAPATTGDPDFERVFRVQQNMLEWMPIFLPSLWMFAVYVADVWAAAIGLLWLAGRALYILDYSEAAEARGRGFAVQATAAGVLFFGACIGVLWRMFAA